MTEKFIINKKSYHIENIYCFIDINNIEKYLKRIESYKIENKPKINIIFIKKDLIYSNNQLNWAIYIAKKRFFDKINISKSLFTETLMILSFTNQIKNISKDFLLEKNKNECITAIICEKKLSKKSITNLKKDLNLKEIKSFKKNTQKIIDFYKIKNKKNIENEILEKMALSLYF
jgi:tRNA threonylcarbamoyladenosine modification (KEOPS) complex Cgi121 subunit